MAPFDPSATDSADETLMLAYAQGRAAAFDTLYARHKGPVYRFFLRHCGNAGDADELFQDLWMRVVRSRESYAPAAKFTTWLYTLARNRLVDHWRSRGLAGFVSIDNEDEDAAAAVDALPGPRTDEPEARAQSREIGRRLHQAIAGLPTVQRDAFLLQQEAGLSLAEIAELTGAGEETVKSRLRYAATRLKAALGDLR